MEVVAHGPLRASVRAEVEYGKSKISVTTSLDAVPATTKLDSRGMIRFDASVNWHQRHEFLKCSRAPAGGSTLALRPAGTDAELGLIRCSAEVKTVVLVLGRKKGKAEKRESWVTVDV
ncbi:hypothetical protein B0H19DRAFT_1251835 [Mycena capillaripes]|nr:hypothetical protein B0H19DRAFT_1251835 [Mycena capillaripes]